MQLGMWEWVFLVAGWARRAMEGTEREGCVVDGWGVGVGALCEGNGALIMFASD